MQRTKSSKKMQGFTLLEVMLIIAIIGILAVVAANSFTGYIARAKRPEVYLALDALAEAQDAYFIANEQYAGSFHDLQFMLDVGSISSDTELVGKYYTYTLSQPYGSDSWYCVASANIDNDDWLDVVVAGKF